ncbi:hypothetical protein ACFQES_04480 [Nonomuraea salmonea]|uniref:hypothetical protein n=1 Tax=Nonomuraea salmonea TaxID=46181 RepID=UPI003609E04A
MNDPEGRWPEERFRQLREQADPDVDKVVAGYLQEQPPGRGALELVKAVVAELGGQTGGQGAVGGAAGVADLRRARLRQGAAGVG